MKKKVRILKFVLLTLVGAYLIVLMAHTFLGNLRENSRLSYHDREIQSIFSVLTEHENTRAKLSDRGLIDRGSCWYIRERDETYCYSLSIRFILNIIDEGLVATVSRLDQYLKDNGFEARNPGNGELLIEAINRNARELNQFEADMEYQKVLRHEGIATRYEIKISLAYSGDCLKSISQNSNNNLPVIGLVDKGEISACTSISAFELHPGRLDWNTSNTNESDGPIRIDPID